MQQKENLRELSKLRTGAYRKDPIEEDFLEKLNENLNQLEAGYLKDDVTEDFPTVFVIGLPRSATTLTTQFIAQGLNFSYINNLIARFWLAPLTGIRLSRILLGERSSTDFQSNYASTAALSDIHEFGYFWRHWLKKENMSDVVRAAEMEGEIEWEVLRKYLLNMQSLFKAPMVFKNIFGSYHMSRFSNLLEKLVFVYIRRDLVDSAISIREARLKYYGNVDLWWSYQPIEYPLIKDLPGEEQIAGQVFFLNRYYEKELQKLESKNTFILEYEDLCKDPKAEAKRLSHHLAEHFDCHIDINPELPNSFPFRTYQDCSADRKRFSGLIEEFQQKNPKFYG